LPFGHQFSKRTASRAGEGQIHARGKTWLIGGFAVTAISHAGFDPAFGVSRNFGLSRITGLDNKPPVSI
jgi:hypothetical protein